MSETEIIFGADTWLIVLLAVAAVGLGYLIYYLYRTERGMVRPRIGVLLTVLRVALLVVLMLMFTEPIISITTTEQRRGKLIVMVDNSRSMQICDLERPDYEKLRIADALGLLRAGHTRSGLRLAQDALGSLLADTEHAAVQWADFAGVMALGVLEQEERTKRLDEALTNVRDLHGQLVALMDILEKSNAGEPGLPPDIARNVAGARQRLASINTRTFDEFLRELGSAEFRSRLTVGRLQKINQLFAHVISQFSQLLKQFREVVVKHDSVLAKAALEVSPDVAAEIDRMTRLELATRMMSDGNVGFLEAIKKDYHLGPYVFSRHIQELPIAEDNSIDAAAASSGDSVEGLYTDFSENLRKAKRAAEGEEIGGIVILSDGRVNHGDDPLKTARLLGAQGVPLYPIVVGSAVAPRDIAVVDITSAEFVHLNDRVEPKVLVKAPGFEGQQLTVEIREKGKVVASRKFKVPLGSSRKVVALRFKPEGMGQHNYIVTVPVQEREVFDGNNEKPFTLSVMEKKLKVLIVDGGPRWEYRYLKNVLLRDKRISLKYILFNPLATSKEERYRGINAFPHKRGALFTFDTIILGDVDPKQFTPIDLANLEAFINDRGGTMIMIGGRNHMPADYAKTSLASALPIIPAENPDDEKHKPPMDGYVLRITPEAQQSPIFRLSPDEKGNIQTWAELPKMMWHAPVKEVKPGAIVWAYADYGDPATADDAVEKRPVILSQAYGLGRVFYMGTDGTWRWRYKVADKYFHQFWGQVILWATSGKLPTGTERVKVGSDKFEYIDGENIIVRGRVLNKDLVSMADAMVSAVLVKRTDDSVVAKTTLDYLERSGGHYEGKFLNVQPGSYSVKLKVAGTPDAELEKVRTDLEVKSAPTRELVDLSANTQFMEDLATRSGGRCFAIDELGRLPGILNPLRWNLRHNRQTPLWNHWLLLVIFCILVTVEWVVRKLEGLL